MTGYCMSSDDADPGQHATRNHAGAAFATQVQPPNESESKEREFIPLLHIVSIFMAFCDTIRKLFSRPPLPTAHCAEKLAALA